METYANLGEESGVVRYLIGNDYLIAEFTPNKYSNITFYKYTYSSTGKSEVEQLKTLAAQGRGLHTYINTPDIKQSYATKGSSLASVQ